VLSSPIFPPRMVSPSPVPTVAFPVVLPAVPSSGSSTTMFNPQSFPPQQALGPSIAPSVAPPCTLSSLPQLPLFAQAQVPQLATQPRSQALSSMRGRGGETLVAAGHVAPRFWVLNWFVHLGRGGRGACIYCVICVWKFSWIRIV
jgi:hypothetical protein